MRRLIILTLALMLVSLTSCGDFRDITVNSATIDAISPYGFRGLDVDLAVEIDNPASQLNLSDMEAVVKHSGKVLGTVTVAPFVLKGRTVQTYDMRASMTLDEKVSLLDLLMSLDSNFLDNCYIDVTVKGQLRVGVSKTITKNDIPLKKLINYADKNK